MGDGDPILICYKHEGIPENDKQNSNIETQRKRTHYI